MWSSFGNAALKAINNQIFTDDVITNFIINYDRCQDGVKQLIRLFDFETQAMADDMHK